MRYLLVITLCLLTVSCSKEETIEIVHGSYPLDIAMGQYVKKEIEERFDIPVKITELSSAYIFSALATGTADISTSVWLPTIHQNYVSSLKGRIDIIGTLYSDAHVGLAVRESLPVNSIEELEEFSKNFESTIYTIEPGAGLVIQAEEAKDRYNLSGWKIQAGSEATMIAAFKAEPWSVITAWSPHEMWSRWKLKFLEDPKGVFGSKESIHIACRKSFKKEHPKIVEFLSTLQYQD